MMSLVKTLPYKEEGSGMGLWEEISACSPYPSRGAYGVLG